MINNFCTKNFECQIIDVYECDYTENYKKHFTINLFCKNIDTKTLCVKVSGFQPTLDVLLENNETKDTLLQDIQGNFCDSKVMKKQLFRGYNKNVTFVRLYFENLKSYKQVKYSLIERKRTLGDCDVPPYFKYFHERNIRLCDWIKISKYREVTSERISSCHTEIEVTINDITPIPEKESICPFLIASFDIETTTPNRNAFPVYTNPKDTIVQIATVLTKYGDPSYMKQHIVTLGPCNDITFTVGPDETTLKNVEVIPCSSEKMLIDQWASFIDQMDPDIITGYNILGYDYEYIVCRSIHLGVLDTLFRLSRLRQPVPEYAMKHLRSYKSIHAIDKQHQWILKRIYQQTKLQSSGIGSVSLKYVETVGRINLDLLKYCREQGDKLSSYKLDNVAKHYKLPQGKNDMPYKRIFEIYSHGGSVEEKTEVAKYCLQDTLICNQLIDKLNVIPNCVGMANTCWIPINFLFTRGQGIKAYSLLLKECSEMNYIIPKITKISKVNLQGGFVLTANKGFYESPVGVLDFASLYPSCIISHNLCTSSLLSRTQVKQMKKCDYRTIAWESPIKIDPVAKKLGISKDEMINAITLWKSQKNNELIKQYFNISHEQLKIVWTNVQIPSFFEKHRCYYVREKIHRGIIPIVLKKLLKKRAATKKLLKQAKDPFMKNIYDAYQKSYKITANSIYGQLGSSFGSFSNPIIAASCTAVGRQLLAFAQNCILRCFAGTHAIYGDTDSVFIQFQLKTHRVGCTNYDLAKKCNKLIEEIPKVNEDLFEKVLENNEYVHCIYDNCQCPEIDHKENYETMIAEHCRVAKIAEQFVTFLLPSPKLTGGVHELEYEKSYYPFMLFTKKRYAGIKIDSNKLDTKGIVLSRRDNCPILKDVYKLCLNLLLSQKPKKALQHLDNTLKAVRTGAIPMDQFIISKSLKELDDYKTHTQPHVILAKRVSKRDPGNAYQPNSRVQFCYIEPKNKTVIMNENVESPEYIQEHNLKINYHYYLCNRLRNPLIQLFSLAYLQKESTDIFEKHIRQAMLKQTRQHDIHKFFRSIKNP